ncbi:hypothetical protein NDN08_004603 [Rhodosorus marinus]|uniref:Quinate/shikimate 5-dehydrogenase/glutamyl-tRNA reductase domain-containing protein n=1 Tax=Rhodosorus marinus TaxID=101924 RepID=A0AAV8UQB2_9RHOD|nr:hypothetical protein NDN08_004603 [Rhodosorus marinus]
MLIVRLQTSFVFFGSNSWKTLKPNPERHCHVAGSRRIESRRRSLRRGEVNAEATEKKTQSLKKKKPKKLVIVSLDQSACSEEFWEKARIPASRWQLVGWELARCESIEEAAVMSTDTKMTILLLTSKNSEGAVREAKNHFRFHGLEDELMDSTFVVLKGQEAAEYSLAQNTGVMLEDGEYTDPLNSLMRSYVLSSDSKLGGMKNDLASFLRAITRVSLDIRRSTGLIPGSVNLPVVAVDQARLAAHDAVGKALEDCRVGVISFGEEGKRMVRTLMSRDVQGVNIVQNDEEQFEDPLVLYPNSNLSTYPEAMLFDVLSISDVVFFTGLSPAQRVVTKTSLERTLFGVKKMLLVDLGELPSLENDVTKAVGVTVIERPALRAGLEQKMVELTDSSQIANELVKDEATKYRNWFFESEEHDYGALGSIP